MDVFPALLRLLAILDKARGHVLKCILVMHWGIASRRRIGVAPRTVPK